MFILFFTAVLFTNKPLPRVMDFQVSILFITLLPILISCMQAVGPNATKEQTDQIKRENTAVAIGNPAQTINVAYMIGGDPTGQRVVFIHGTPGMAVDWGDFLLDVPPGMEYVAFDRPGFGASGPDDHAVTSFSDHLDVLETFLVERNGKKPIVVGHSMGGTLAYLAALRYGERLAGVVVASGALNPKLEKVLFIQKVAPYFYFMLPRWLKNTNEELLHYRSELEKYEPLLSQVHIPMIIIHGTKDNLVPYANVAFMMEKLAEFPDVKVVTLEGADHFIPWSYKAEFDRAIREIVSKN